MYVDNMIYRVNNEQAIRRQNLFDTFGKQNTDNTNKKNTISTIRHNNRVATIVAIHSKIALELGWLTRKLQIAMRLCT